MSLFMWIISRSTKQMPFLAIVLCASQKLSQAFLWSNLIFKALWKKIYLCVTSLST